MISKSSISFLINKGNDIIVYDERDNDQVLPRQVIHGNNENGLQKRKVDNEASPASPKKMIKVNENLNRRKIGFNNLNSDISTLKADSFIIPHVVWISIILRDFTFSNLLQFRLVCKTYNQIAQKAASFKCSQHAKTAINLLFDRGFVAAFAHIEKIRNYFKTFQLIKNPSLEQYNKVFDLLRNKKQESLVKEEGLQKILNINSEKAFTEKIRKACSISDEKFEFKKNKVTDPYFETLIIDFSAPSENIDAWFDVIEIVYLILDNDNRKSVREKLIQNIKYILQQLTGRGEEQLLLIYALLRMNHDNYSGVLLKYIGLFETIIGAAGISRTISNKNKDEVVKIILFKQDEIMKALNLNLKLSKEELIKKTFRCIKEMIDRIKAYLEIRSKDSKTMALLQPKILNFEDELKNKFPDHYGEK